MAAAAPLAIAISLPPRTRTPSGPYPTHIATLPPSLNTHTHMEMLKSMTDSFPKPWENQTDGYSTFRSSQAHKGWEDTFPVVRELVLMAAAMGMSLQVARAGQVVQGTGVRPLGIQHSSMLQPSHSRIMLQPSHSKIMLQPSHCRIMLQPSHSRIMLQPLPRSTDPHHIAGLIGTTIITILLLKGHARRPGPCT